MEYQGHIAKYGTDKAVEKRRRGGCSTPEILLQLQIQCRKSLIRRAISSSRDHFTYSLNQAHKRARISGGRSIGSESPRDQSPSTYSSEDDPNESPNAESHEDSTLPPSTQYEILRDNGFKHLENPDLDDQRATQRFLARRDQIGDNHAAENGIIEEIT